MGLFSSDKSSTPANHTCPNLSLADPPQVPFIGSMSFHTVSTIVAGAATIISCLVCFYLIFSHATHYAVPKEQKQIIRIVFIVPVFAILSFLSVAFPKDAIYFTPLDDLYEGFALSAFFLMLLAFIQEDDDDRNTFFQTSGLVASYRKTSLLVFQFPVVEFLLTILTEITQATGTYCQSSSKLYFAHVWVMIINGASTAIAVMAVLKFYKTVKPQTQARKPMAKLIAFKGIVFLNFVQTFIFGFLTTRSDLHPSDKLTYLDLTVGIPNMVICIEMIIFSIALVCVYRTKEYIFRKGASTVPLGHGGYSGGFLGFGAYLEALNFSDVLRAIVAAISGAASQRVSGGSGYPTKPYGSGQEVAYDRVELTAPENTRYDPHPQPHYPTQYDGQYAGGQYPGAPKNTSYDP